MTDLEQLEFDPRVFSRRSGAPDAEGSCVIYWMQRSQRAADNDALNIAMRSRQLCQSSLHELVMTQIRVMGARQQLKKHQHRLAELVLNVGFVLHADPDEDFFALLRRRSSLSGDR